MGIPSLVTLCIKKNPTIEDRSRCTRYSIWSEQLPYLPALVGRATPGVSFLVLPLIQTHSRLGCRDPGDSRDLHHFQEGGREAQGSPESAAAEHRVPGGQSWRDTLTRLQTHSCIFSKRCSPPRSGFPFTLQSSDGSGENKNKDKKAKSGEIISISSLFLFGPLPKNRWVGIAPATFSPGPRREGESWAPLGAPLPLLCVYVCTLTSPPRGGLGQELLLVQSPHSAARGALRAEGGRGHERRDRAPPGTHPALARTRPSPRPHPPPGEQVSPGTSSPSPPPPRAPPAPSAVMRLGSFITHCPGDAALGLRGGAHCPPGWGRHVTRLGEGCGDALAGYLLAGA